MEWVLTHMGDPDFNDPLPPQPDSDATATSAPAADPEAVTTLESMGFITTQVQHQSDNDALTLTSVSCRSHLGFLCCVGNMGLRRYRSGMYLVSLVRDGLLSASEGSNRGHVRVGEVSLCTCSAPPSSLLCLSSL